MSSVNDIKDKSALLDEVDRRAYQYLHDGNTLACSQTVLLVIQEVLGQVDGTMVKACGPLAGGSHCGSLCGGLVGGLLAIGMKYGPGREDLGNYDILENSYQYAKKMYERFEKEFGSWYCNIITGFPDRDDPEQRRQWIESGGKEACARLCGKAARMALDVMLNG